MDVRPVEFVSEWEWFWPRWEWSSEQVQVGYIVICHLAAQLIQKWQRAMDSDEEFNGGSPSLSPTQLPEGFYVGYATDSDPENCFESLRSSAAQGTIREPTAEDELLATNQVKLNSAPAEWQIQGEILNDIADRIVRLYEEEQGIPRGSKGSIDFSQFLDIEHCHRLGPADPLDADKFIANINELKSNPVACRYLARRHMYYAVYEYVDRGRSDFLGDEGNAALYQVWWSPPSERVGFSMLRNGKGQKRERTERKDPEEAKRLAEEKAVVAVAKLAAKVQKQEAAAEKKREAAGKKVVRGQEAAERKQAAAIKKAGVEARKAEQLLKKEEKTRELEVKKRAAGVTIVLG
jgi:hypothetical protein